MSTDFRTCPHCNKPGSKVLLSAEKDQGTRLTYVEGLTGVYRIYHCDNPICGKNFFVHIIVKKTQNIHEDLTSEFEYPIAKTKTHKSIPEKISKSYAEAIKCLNSGALNATSIMFRRVLEQVCADKNATGSNLPKKIESIIESKTLKSMMTIIKEFGVLANHDDRYYYEINPDDIPKLQQFIDHLFQEVYIIPHDLDNFESTLSSNKKKKSTNS